MDGWIDSLSLWGRPLTAAERTELYNGGIGLDYDFTGGGGGDTTAPTLSNPAGTATGSTTADGTVDTDEGNGTLYAVVTTSSTNPSAAQVKAGQDHTGAAASYADSQAISTTGTKTFNASGLSPSTAYYFHFMHEDAATNQSSVASSASFTTASAESPLPGAMNTYRQLRAG